MRQDVYGVAYAEARAELGSISGRFEQLRARKEHLEGVIHAISTVLGVEPPKSPSPQSAGTRTANTAPSQVPTQPTSPQGSDPTAYTFNQVPVPLPDVSETGGDPFQRRVRNALKMAGAGGSQQDLQTAV